MSDEIWSLFGTNLAVMVVVMTVISLQLKKTKPQYVDYIATTSGFVPLPKRKQGVSV